jgi:hypothetical protein
MDCRQLITEHTDYLAEGFSCRALDEDRVLLITPYQLPDGDLIELAVEQRTPGIVRVRDLGETLSSLISQGFDPMGSEKRRWLLEQAMKLTGVELDAGELRKDGPDSAVGALVLDVAAAARAVGDLIYLHRSQDPQDFETRVVTFLSDHAPNVQPKVTVKGLSGHPYRITARVHRPEGPPLLVSTLAPRSQSQVKTAVDRIVRQWVDINHDVQRTQKVSFLNDIDVRWNAPDLRLLARFSLVTGWRERHRVTPVLEGRSVEPELELPLPLWDLDASQKDDEEPSPSD